MRLNFVTATRAMWIPIVMMTALMLHESGAQASDNLLFERASWEFEGAESIGAWQVQERLAVELVCAIVDAPEGRLYPGFIGSIRKAGDEIIGDYLLLTIETADFARQTITLIDNPEGDVSSSNRMITLRGLPRSESLMFRLNQPNGEAHEYCWEARPVK
jgi:hypothetical protein